MKRQSILIITAVILATGTLACQLPNVLAPPAESNPAQPASPAPPTVTPPQPTLEPTPAAPKLESPSPAPNETQEPGLSIQGSVRLENGAELANVTIYRNFAAYEGVVAAMTDQDGNYRSEFIYIPGDEMVGVWAELDGYTFEPESYRWRHYSGHLIATVHFVAYKTP